MLNSGVFSGFKWSWFWQLLSNSKKLGKISVFSLVYTQTDSFNIFSEVMTPCDQMAWVLFIEDMKMLCFKSDFFNERAIACLHVHEHGVVL